MELDFKKIVEIERKWQKEWEKSKIFESNVSDKRKFFITFPYPYVNGAPHIGHSYTFFRIESYARFKRLQGFNVLFPQSFHATGEPILGTIERLKEGDETQAATFKLFGASDEEIKNFVEKGPEYTALFWMKKWIEILKLAGASIDWRRTFITAITPMYNKFIEWQYNTLKKKGYIVQGTHPVVWCPKCQSPTGDHDRLKGEGESPVEFYIIKFKLDSGEIIPCATLRPETIYGVTNIWIKPDTSYLKVKIGGETWILSKDSCVKLSDQLKKIEILGELNSNTLLGKLVTNPITGEAVPILPAKFVELRIGTGIVMSVPAHAPFDFIGLQDLKKVEDLKMRELVEGIEIKKIIYTPGLGEIPAKEVCEKFNISNQDEREKLELATEELYKKEFHKGVMTVEDYKNVPVSEAKKKIIENLKKINSLDSIWEPSGEVICRCKTRCYIKILENQWFLKYSDLEWKKKAKKALSSMRIYPEEAREQFLNTIDWLENKACARKTGLGTKLPWDKEWIVETLSDSTIYMCLYTIYHLIKDLNAEKIKDSFFDYIFLGKGNVRDVARENFVSEDVLEKARKEFEYFYPVDFRGSGKDLIQNHLTFFIFHHVAIWDEEKYWPKAIGVNGFVNVMGEKMSKSKGNVIPLIDLINQFGSDLVRLNIISSAEDLNDADWRFENIQTFFERIKSIFWLIENSKKAEVREKKNIDRFIEVCVKKNILEAEKMYEELKFRSASQLLIFDILNKIDWYLKRVGGIERANRKTLEEILKLWVKALSPLLPHLSEEMWSMLGEKGFVFESGYPRFEIIEEKYIDFENFIQQTTNDIKEIIKIVKKEPKEIFIIVGSKKKFDLYESFLNGKIPSMEAVLKSVEDEKEKQSMAKFYKKMEDAYRKKELTKVLDRKNQIDLLKENLEFFEREFGCRVNVVEEEESTLEKKYQATPSKPAIYFLS